MEMKEAMNEADRCRKDLEDQEAKMKSSLNKEIGTLRDKVKCGLKFEVPNFTFIGDVYSRSDKRTNEVQWGYKLQTSE